MAPEKKVAIITGGASGMGLAVCTALSSRPDWTVHMLDLNAPLGAASASQIGATFHQTDVTSYPSLSSAFKEIFLTHRRLDFVHANAGIIEKGDFYGQKDTGDEPPPEFTRATVEINLLSVMQTCHLALHYMRQTPREIGRSVLVTASCGGLYAVPNAPAYAAAKFGCLGWVRSIAGRLWFEDGIRVNAICPGTVRTNLLTDKQWENFPMEYFTPVEKIVEVVMMLIEGDGKQTNDAGAGEPLWGQAVEVNCDKHYFRKQHDYCDEKMEAVMGATEARWRHDQGVEGK